MVGRLRPARNGTVVADPALGTRPIVRSSLDVPADGGDLRIHVASPGSPAAPAVLLVHEKRGVDVHTRHIADVLAEHGYSVFVPDLLWRYGGSKPDRAVSARGIPGTWHLDDLAHALGAIRDAFGVREFGVIGYSFGAEMAVRLSELSGVRVIVTYFAHPNAEAWSDLTVPVLAVFGGTPDQLDRAHVAEEILRDDPSPVLIRTFAGPRAFENPHRPDRYRETSARQAWVMTLEWLRQHLR